jgi:hypothetical protein
VAFIVRMEERRYEYLPPKFRYNYIRIQEVIPYTTIFFRVIAARNSGIIHHVVRYFAVSTLN